METKDLINLIINVVCNGIVIFMIQSCIAYRMEKLNKRNSLKLQVLELFWQKLQNLNTTMIQVNIKVQESPDYLNEGLDLIKVNISDIIEYYDTNNYDLNIFNNEFTILNNSWNDFVNFLKDNINNLNFEKQIKVGEKLQLVKENNLKLISVVRKKY